MSDDILWKIVFQNMYVYTWLIFLAVRPFLHVCISSPFVPSPPLSSLPLLYPPLLFSPVSSSLRPFLTRNLDLFLDDKDEDDGSIPKKCVQYPVYHMYTTFEFTSLLRCFTCSALICTCMCDLAQPAELPQ